MIIEDDGRWTCTECGNKWSATLGDNEIPEVCECETEYCRFCGNSYRRSEGHSCMEMRGGLDSPNNHQRVMFDKLKSHIGHAVVVVGYGPTNEESVNVAVECEDCGEVIIDFEHPDREQS